MLGLPPDFPGFSFRISNSNAFSRTSDVSHVHRSPRHRGRRASPPRRFVCPGPHTTDPIRPPHDTAKPTAVPRRGPVSCRAAGWGRPIGAERSQTPIFGTISFGLQPSGSSSQPSPRRFQTISLRNRWPGAQLSNECLHRLSCTSFPTPSSPPRFPTSQVRHPRLRARACMGIMGGLGQSVYQLIFKTKSFVSTRPCTRIDISVFIVTQGSIYKLCLRTIYRWYI